MGTYIDDFGEKIGGAKKDSWRHRGLSVEDLYGMNIKECAEYVTKENVWPTPDWASYKGKMEPACILHMKNVREKIPSKIVMYGNKADIKRSEMYINLLNYLRECCEKITTVDKIGNIHNDYRKFYASGENIGIDYTLYNNLMITQQEIECLKTECIIQNFPDEYHGAVKGIRVIRTYSGYKLGNKTKYYVNKSFATKEEAIDYARNTLIREIEEARGTKKKSELVTVIRPQLEHVERFGPNLRNNTDATPDNMLKVFDFRGGEFGNWNTQEDRQACLNYAFDAFIDLAYAMNMPVSFIGLGSKKDRGNK